SNPSKFRKLKRCALHANISGLVKAGKPGVLVFDGEMASIRTFLEGARGLRYLNFHHVDTQPLPLCLKNRVANAKIGLHEVAGMHCLVSALDALALKDWFREQMGMSKGS
ncbi:hypothetical protein K443DRAFT_81071, partial [Laccaria amethystina LaAM-08-1]